jgi:hypothetical protein
MKSHKHKQSVSVWIRYLGVGTAAALLMGVQSASAADSGPTVEGSICMQKVFGTPVSSSNLVNCTANDISLSDVISVSPSTCTRGSTFDLEATFAVDVTSRNRYDAGFFFRTDGEGTARGTGTLATGTCSLSALTPGGIPGQQLDGDTCGDLDQGLYDGVLPDDNPKAVTFTIPGVVCEPAPGTNQLRLPYCTSWHSNQGTACDISSPDFLTADAFDFKPDTKSKCVCNDNFTVPVTVEDATITTTKDVTGTVSETGGMATYTVTIHNDAQFESVTIASIKDFIDPNGTNDEVDLTTIPACGTGEPDSTTPFCTADGQTSCASLIGDVLAPDEESSCQFKAFISGNAGDNVEDTVDACVTQTGGAGEICDDDPAEVHITGVFTAPTLGKTVNSTANCTVEATYTVAVNNPSSGATAEDLSLAALTDDKFGVITTTHPAGTSADAFCNGLTTCEQVVSTNCGVAIPTGAGVLPATIAAGASYSCSFVGKIVSSACDFTHTNTATGTVTDGDKHCSVTNVPGEPNGAAACLTSSDCSAGQFCVANQSLPTGNASVSVDVDPPVEP